MKTIIKIINTLFILGHFLYAQGISYNKEFVINTITESDQFHPSIAVLDDGGFIAVWAGDVGDGNYDVSCQIFNSDGSEKGNEFVVNSNVYGAQWEPNISFLSDGRFAICWYSVPNIYLQIHSKDGSLDVPEFIVNENTGFTHSRYSPKITILKNDNIAICWESNNQDGSSMGLYGFLFDKQGKELSQEFLINTYTDNNQNEPDICTLSDGGFVVCWNSEWQDGDEYGIYAQIFNQDGSKRGTELQVNVTKTADQKNPAVSGLTDSRFIVCWQSMGQDGSGYGIFGQIFNKNGLKEGSEFIVNTTTLSDQQFPDIAGLGDGGFVTCWQSKDADQNGIFAQLFNNDATKRGFEFQINDIAISYQRYPRIAASANNRIVVCWQSFGHDGDRWGIFGKYYLDTLNHVLKPQELIKPTNDKIFYSLNPAEFSWTSATYMRMNFPWDVQYKIYFDDTEDFSSPLVYESIFDTTSTFENFTPGTTYFWKVLAKNIADDSLWSSETFGFFVDWDATTSLEEITENHPLEFKLHQNYPNPFNPKTIINYELPARSAGGGITNSVKLTVYDITGREVQILVNQQQSAGRYSVTFNADNLSSGVYFYHIQMGSYLETRKMLLLR